MSEGVPTAPKTRDRGMLVIVALVGVNVGWLLMTPVVPGVAMATMRRFHLDYDSFGLWAIQQTIPSMYNFANRYQVQTDAQQNGDVDVDTEVRYANHFPIRILTFADTRIKHLRSGQDCWLTIETSYRGQSIRSKFHAQATQAHVSNNLSRADPAERTVRYSLIRVSTEPVP